MNVRDNKILYLLSQKKRLNVIFSILRIQTEPLFLFSLLKNYRVLDCFPEVIKELVEDCRFLITHLYPMFH